MQKPTPHQLKADYARALELLARGRSAEAREILSALARVARRAPEPHYQLGRLAVLDRDYEAAEAHLRTAAKLKPGEPAILALQAELFEAQGRTDEALAAFDALIARVPKAAKPRADKAILLQRLGDFEAAEREFREALRHNPREGELYRVFLASKKLGEDDPMIAEMEALYADPALPDEARMHLGFALAKAMEDTKRYDRVFGYLDTANGLQRRAFPFDVAERLAEADAVVASVDRTEGLAQGDPEFQPIFVSGMPRSGTTLVEQVIAAHSTVTAGGELGHALKEYYRRFRAGRAFTPVSKAHAATHRAFAGSYESRVRAELRFGRRFTDKSIQTHLILGYLSAVLPGARFVVVRRDPRDVALSIYKNHFKGGTHRYSNDLRDIARYMRHFERVVADWRERLPGVIHEVAYEDLVSDPEPQARALVAAAGLDWEPGCLEFHKQGGAVKTLSLHQVRQPIYKSSAEAWRRYETELAPFLEEWEKTA